MKKLIALVFGVLLAWPMAAQAAEDSTMTGRLQRIQKHKTIVMGYYETGIPYSYLDNTGQRGFGVAISKRIAAAIQKHLKLDKLTIRWNPMTVSTRMSLVAANVVDVECTSTSHKRKREKHVGFSNTFFVSSNAFATRADSGIKSAQDLIGKRVAVVAGSRNVKNAKKLGNIILVEEQNNPRAMQALQEGRADALFSNLGLVTREMLRIKDASPYVVYPLGTNASGYACMLPKGDKAIKKIADETIASMMKNGEMEKLFNQWFANPIPPYGRSANVQLDKLNKELYLNPNDKPLK
ncbi:amino acid ABC transporter substrate-binding protein [Magnetococcus sp. PR-3]|uniref:amino acid ABC transporter substrate-binding protein n=1 Tax=Magnetococcus sp. PR-3 TaxID=3120355 RepID=UPI002FCE3950